MMRSRWQHGSSSGELDVFGATSYFAAAAAGLPDRCPGGEPASDRLIQQANKATTHGATRMEDMVFCGYPHRVPQGQLGLHGGEELHAQLGVAAKPTSSGKTSKLAALLSFMVSPSPRSSFRKTESLPPPSPPASSNNKKLSGGDEVMANTTMVSSSSSSSRELRGCGGVHEVDLGVAMGDRRLQGVRVVKGGGDQQRWVVRCSAWDEEHHESSGHKDDEVEGGDGGDHGGNWESDSSSDLFDLDLECLC